MGTFRNDKSLVAPIAAMSIDEECGASINPGSSVRNAINPSLLAHGDEGDIHE